MEEVSVGSTPSFGADVRAGPPHANLFSLVQYNVEAMSMDRLRDFAAKLEARGVTMATLQGTRWRFDMTAVVGSCKCFCAGAGGTAIDSAAGCIVMIKADFLRKCQVKRMLWQEHRMLAIRFSGSKHDFTVISA